MSPNPLRLPDPLRLVVITGTGTEVGKTWVGCAVLIEARRRDLTVAVRKPVQSFSPGDHTRDSELLAQASGEEEAAVCREEDSFPAPMAPPMAAEALGRPLPTIAGMADHLRSSWPAEGCDLALVEGAGGVASPLAADGDTAALARAVAAHLVVVVAEASLGVIGLVRLAARALSPLRVVVHLNRFEPADDLHRRNAAWLAERDGFEVTTGLPDLFEAVLRA